MLYLLPLHPEMYNTSNLPDFTSESIAEVRNVVRGKLTEWMGVEKPRGLAGMYDSLFNYKMDRKDAVKLFMNDSETDGIIMIGEIGGQLEADAARWIKENGTKPVIGFIAGQTAPAGRTMGHAGAIVGGKDDTAEAKMAILRECSITVAESPAEIGKLMSEKMGVSI